MKCPKCGGTLLVISTPNVKDVMNLECIDINLECSEDEEHTFFVRVREEDLLEGA